MKNTLKQSTARYILLGPFLDKTDGVTEETGLAGSMTVYVSKGGAAQAARNSSTSITYDARGYYRVHLDATDTGTLGDLIVIVHDSATHLPVWKLFTVVPAMVYDAMISGTDYMDTQVKAIDADAITASSIATDAVTEIQNGLASATNLSTAQTLLNSIAGYIDTEVAAIKVKTDYLPSATAGAAGGLVIGAGTGTLTLSNSGRVYALDSYGVAVATATNLSTAQTLLNSIAGYIDTEVAAIKVKTDYLPSATAGAAGGLLVGSGTGTVVLTTGGSIYAVDNSGENLPSAANLATANSSITTIAGYLDTEVAAIKAKTDLIPASPATEGTLADIAGSVASILDDTASSGVLVANAAKTGYALASTGLDSIAITAPTGVASNFREMVVQVWRRWFKKTTLTATELETFADDGVTALTTQAVSDSSGTETVGDAS